MDCRTPTEAAYIPPSSLHPNDVTEYKEELCLSLLVAMQGIGRKEYPEGPSKDKKHYDKARGAKPASLKTGEWVLVRFPQDKQGRKCKLSRPWHGPYRVVLGRCTSPMQDPQIRVHESRVKHYPANFPAGFYWYGGKRRGPGRPPKWVTTLLDTMESQDADGDSVDLSEDGADVSQESADQDPDDCESSVDGDDGPDESLADLFQPVSRRLHYEVTGVSVHPYSPTPVDSSYKIQDVAEKNWGFLQETQIPDCSCYKLYFQTKM